ncbi:hypothetical protein PanWU01x14_214730 [Parasponia andersonii]|uniref:Uncharacterized protein n=1 Tax=Parasponia andersonii TaxID=3476 RepID=A0A2P5BS75_PARAD|nr:hypothetical protein PanWU01x14_214730 [Parasponia andersonii]
MVQEGVPDIKVLECVHLLDFLYDMITPKMEPERPDVIFEVIEESQETKEGDKEGSIGNSNSVKQLLTAIWKMVSTLDKGKEEGKPEEENSNNKPTLIEEITIPSVTELSKSGVHFFPTNDVNAEVIIRNLVAYEAANASEPLVFTRYTELMNGIIDTEEDVKILRERGTILNRLKSDEEVANLWNGTSKSIRLTRVPFLDKVIEDVNKYHNGRWRVKFGKVMKLYSRHATK